MKTVVLQSFNNYFSAHIALSRLQGDGINCWLLDENTATINPILGNAIGGIRLSVDENDAVPARVLLKQYHEEYMQAAVCPRCGRHEIIEVPSQSAGSILTSILTWLFSSYSVAAEYVYQCRHCGYESKILPDVEYIPETPGTV